MENLTVSLKKIIDQSKLEIIYEGKGTENIFIDTPAVNRPGLVLTGFSEHFQKNRIQVLGTMEYAYLASKTLEQSKKSLEHVMIFDPLCIIISGGKPVHDYIIDLAKEYKVTILSTEMSTIKAMNSILQIITSELAPRTTIHGVFLEVYGEGVLITGESGIGKSETAIELVHRGHSLIADDAVIVKKVDENTLIGYAPENIRHFIELRGIGIINVRRLFGVGAVKTEEEISLIIHLENWDNLKKHDRLGLEDNYKDILDVKIPILEIPVKTGRNIANIVEVAVKNLRQKKLGYNSAKELLKQLGMEY